MSSSTNKLKIFEKGEAGEYKTLQQDGAASVPGSNSGKEPGDGRPLGSEVPTQNKLQSEATGGADGGKREWRFEGLDAFKLCGLFEMDLIDLQSSFKSVNIKRHPSFGMPKEVTIKCSEEEDFERVNSKINKLTKRVKDCFEEEVPIEVDKWMKATVYVKKCPAVADVLHYLSGPEGYKVIVIGQDYTQVTTAVHKMKVELDMVKTTNRRKGSRSGGGSLRSESVDDDTTDISSSARPGTSSDSSFSYEFRLQGGFLVKVYSASIIKVKVDAIVNAANESMAHAGGVARVISEAAGRALDMESKQYAKTYGGSVGVTESIVTNAGNLRDRFKGVIHAVGPQWSHYRKKEDCLEDLRMTVIKMMKRCDQRAYVKVAMPAISAGIFGVPKELCADMYVKAAVDFSEDTSRGDAATLQELHFVDVDVSILKMVQNSHEKWKKDSHSLDPASLVKEYVRSHPQSDRGGYGGQRGYRRQRSFDISETTESRGGYGGYGQHGHRGQKSFDSGGETAKGSGTFADKVVRLKQVRMKFGSTAEVFEIDEKVEVWIYQGSIVKVRDIGAIVCSIDKSGVSIYGQSSRQGFIFEAIKKEGGVKFESEFSKMKDGVRNQLISNGTVLRCRGGDLGAKGVVFLVMDRLSVTDFQLREFETGLLKVLDKCENWKYKQIALPLIGIGAIQNDSGKLESCCWTLLSVLVDYCSKRSFPCVSEIHLVNNSEEVCSMLKKTFLQSCAKTKSVDSGRTHGESGSYIDRGNDDVRDRRHHRSGSSSSGDEGKGYGHGGSRYGENGSRSREPSDKSDFSSSRHGGKSQPSGKESQDTGHGNKKDLYTDLDDFDDFEKLDIAAGAGGSATSTSISASKGDDVNKDKMKEEEDEIPKKRIGNIKILESE